MTKYMLPRPERLSLSETLMQSLSKDNYRLWMHEMLYLEEMAELGFVQRWVSVSQEKYVSLAVALFCWWMSRLAGSFAPLLPHARGGEGGG